MGTMNTPEGPRGPDPRRDLPNPEAALGGADDVAKTTYVTGSGTSPEARRTDDAPIARVKAGSGLGIGGWILIAIVAAIAIFYGGALFS